jgi:glycosyltransferase involved in cell wall biosynthesis
VVPYGTDPSFAAASRPRPHGGPLRVLSVGEVGLRKGAPYVLDAARQLAGRAQFRMVGSVNTTAAARRELAAHVELLGALPRSEMLAHYAWADVLLLPSLCEGSSGATYEALLAGLPVVTTRNTGSLVRDGEDGFVVPIRDAEAIGERLLQLADHPDRVTEMSRAASARQTEFSLEGYQQRLLEILLQHLATAP